MGERKSPWPGFVGPSYQGQSTRFEDQRCVNLYVEYDENQGVGNPTTGKNQQASVLLGTPGLKFAQSLGSGPIRGLHTASNEELAYVVVGNQVFSISAYNAIPTQLTGNLSSSTGPVSIADNGGTVLIVDGTNGYWIEIGGATVNTISDPNFYPASTVTFQDEFFICSATNTNSGFTSNPSTSGEPTWPDLNTFQKTGNGDLLSAVVSVNRQLFLLGQRTIEIWANNTSTAQEASTTPFVRQNGRFSQNGCIAPYSVVVLGENFYFLSSNDQGGGMVLMVSTSSPTPVRVGTHAIEEAIQSAGDLSLSTAYGYQQNGHYFYCLNVPNLNTTLVFDTTESGSYLWHERQSYQNGAIGRHLGQVHCYLNGQHLIGDYGTNNIYIYDFSTYTDNGQPLPRIRQLPHLADNSNNIIVHLIDLDMQFGVGLTNDGNNPQSNVSPQVTLEISVDGGQTFGLPIFADIGKIGNYTTRARFSRCGMMRDGIFRITVTDAVKVQMLSCMTDVEVCLC